MDMAGREEAAGRPPAHSGASARCKCTDEPCFDVAHCPNCNGFCPCTHAGAAAGFAAFARREARAACEAADAASAAASSSAAADDGGGGGRTGDPIGAENAAGCARAAAQRAEAEALRASCTTTVPEFAVRRRAGALRAARSTRDAAGATRTLASPPTAAAQQEAPRQ